MPNRPTFGDSSARGTDPERAGFRRLQAGSNLATSMNPPPSSDHANRAALYDAPVLYSDYELLNRVRGPFSPWAGRHLTVDVGQVRPAVGVGMVDYASRLVTFQTVVESKKGLSARRRTPTRRRGPDEWDARPRSARLRQDGSRPRTNPRPGR